MADFEQLGDEEVEKVLAAARPGDGAGSRANGHGAGAHDASLRELVGFLTLVRAAYVRAPSDETASAHLTAVALEAAPLRIAATAAHGSASRGDRRPRRLRITSRRLALLPAAVLGAFLAAAGLAVAGVNLPDAARAPFDELGIELPNQARSSDVHAVIDATEPADRGCAFGQAVASAASQGHAQPAGNQCDHGDEGAAQDAADHGQGAEHGQGANQAGGEQGGAGAHGKPAGVPPTPPAGDDFGHSTATDAQKNASTDGRDFGERTSDSAQSLTPAAPPAGAGSQDGSETGQANADQGRSTAGDTPAGSRPGGSHIP